MSFRPRGMSYGLTRFPFERRTVRIEPQTANTAGANDIIIFRLPENCLVDLQSIVWSYIVACPTTATTSEKVTVPRGSESVIERLEITAGGQSLVQGFYDYKSLVRQMLNYTCGQDGQNSRQILEGETPLEDAGSLVNFVTERRNVVNWLGFVSGNATRYISTANLGTVEMRIQLAPNTILSMSGLTDAALAKYTLSGFYMFADTVAVNDAMFHKATAETLAAGEPLSLAFKNYQSFQESHSGLINTTKFNVNSASVDRIWTTSVLTANLAIGVPANGDWKGFNFAAQADRTTLQLQLDSEFYPNFPIDAQSDLFTYSRKSLGNMRDVLGGVLASDRDEWLTVYWGAVFGFQYEGDAEPAGAGKLVSGKDMRGSTAQAILTSQGSAAGAACTAKVWVEMTSVLQIYAGRQLTLIV